MPIQMIRFDVFSDVGGIKIGRARFSFMTLERMLCPGKVWYRVVSVTNGVPVIERMVVEEVNGKKVKDE